MITVNKNDDLNKALSVAENFLQEQDARRGEREKTLRKKLVRRKAEGHITNKINCCPKCGCTIEVSELCQYSRDHIIGKRGKMLKNYKTNDNGYIDVSIASCTNPSCDVRWEADEFKIDEDGYFVDFKYTESERDL